MSLYVLEFYEACGSRGLVRLRPKPQTGKLRSISFSRGNFCDLEAVRERILSGLRVGKQSPEYKRTKAVIDRFIAELR